MTSAQSEISSLREQINKGYAEKLELKREVCVLRNNLENHDKDVDELRAEASSQPNCYKKH